MELGSLPAGTPVFVDTNILVYHFSSDPKFGVACKQFIDRVARQEVDAYSSSHVATDVAHRMMTVEAIMVLGWPIQGIARRLKRQHAEIAKLGRFRQSVDEMPRLGIHVEPVTHSMVSAAATISQQFGLLSGDALIIAVMQQLNLKNLASNDADFDRVPWLTRYTPS